MDDQIRLLIFFVIGMIAISFLASQFQNVMYDIQSNKLTNYTLNNFEIVSCKSMQLTNCGIVLEGCTNNVSYYCLSKVKKYG